MAVSVYQITFSCEKVDYLARKLRASLGCEGSVSVAMGCGKSVTAPGKHSGSGQS